MFTPLIRQPALEAPDVPLVGVGLLVSLAFAASVAAPLATYAVTLGVFGMPHVIQELRYIDRRFRSWWGAWTIPLGAALLGVCASRLLDLFGAIEGDVQRSVELTLALVLVVGVAPFWMRRGLAGAVGLAAVAAVVGGLVWWPIAVLLAVAVLHNWTPVALILEALTGADRPRAAGLLAVAFGAMPLAIASGVPWALADAAGVGFSEADLLRAGPLTSNFTAYLPVTALGWDSAQHLFSAIVFAQCLHYIAVLGVLPRLGGHGERLRTSVPWAVVLGLGSLAIFALFALDFRLGRAFYGSFAAIHAWVEVPLFLAMLSVGRQGASRS